MIAVNEFRMGFLLGAMIIGVICGLFPLGIAARKNRHLLGFAFFFVTAAVCFLSGARLGVPTALVLCLIAKLLPHKRFRPEDL